MALDALHTGCCCVLLKLGFEFFVFFLHHEADVHQRAVFFLCRAAEEFVAVDFAVEQFGACLGAAFHFFHAALRLDPFQILQGAVDGHHGRGVEHRAFIDVRAIVEHRGNGTAHLAYINEEKAFMQPLPVNAYEPAIWSDATVPTDYCVTDGLNRYSVPYDLIGEQVQSRVTRDIVEFFYHGNRVASHVRLHHRQPDPVVKTEHMPDNHKKYLSYNKDAFLEWAGTIGKNTEKVILTFLQEGRAPEQGYKSCRNLMKLCEKYGSEKLEEACRSMLTFSGTPNIRSLMQLLKTPIRQSTVSSPASESHGSRGITRGASQFRKGGDQ